MRLIYLDIDSLRPDHMGCYGYARNTTPNIDAIAAQGVRFNHCYCASSPCVPSRASFMSGRFAINHGALTHWGPGYDFYYPEGETHSETYAFFTRRLREAGYRTVTFSSFGDRHHAWWYFAGWNEVHTHTLKEGNEDADEVNAAVIPWLRSHGTEENYFLHIQYWDPHTLYTYPQEFAEQWREHPAKPYPTEEEIAAHQADRFPHSAAYLHTDRVFPATMPNRIANREDYIDLLNGYDGGISYMDKHVGEIVQTLHELGIQDEVCFIISADHGESLGEHGIYAEHASATESVHHLPLIIKAPGITKPGTVVNGLIYNVDVVATITDLAGLPVPSGWDGASFSPVLRGEHWQGRDYLVMDHALYTCQRAVRDQKWYFIRTYHPGLYNFEPVSLYDMEHDPNQTTNVADMHPDIVKEMDHRLSQWLHEHLGKPGHSTDPLQKVVETGPWKYVTLEGWVQRLREKGDHEAADHYERAYRN
ncbi:sulfatase [Paenibacillus lutrae]|uniref:Sulfatase-like hydrolase/transferase n=1 Tax=Paenibacillus lutrae TaxID=2078573 RepID=A0A7X3FFD1_9BACL|nr:sulfatase [Paenibacillus lutrae]MVO98411.1 sulfatase-like hydrolase/transferase [Paenibacillus lutrae]